MERERLWELMRARHSVRRYLDRPIEAGAAAALREEIERVKSESGLGVSLWLNEPEAFCAGRPHYGHFANCRNYIVLAGRRGDDRKVGYYGERLVLAAQDLGLNSCWVALTYEHGKVPVALAEGEKIFDLIALGYGETQGTPHKSKPLSRVAKLADDDPAWYREGLEAALLAPTAINQQRFYFERTDENTVSVKALLGPCSKTDLGIVQYHFECGAGKENFVWEEPTD